MARFVEPSSGEVAAWDEWLVGRPLCIREVASRFDPWTLYRFGVSGHRVTILSFSEGPPVSLTVYVSGRFNFVAFERDVFGVRPEDLVECDLPGVGERVGVVLSDGEVEENIDGLRLLVRPDLWVRRPDGSVVRKDCN